MSPAKFGLAMGYLDDHWMRVRAEAKRQGAILDYHRIQNAVLMVPGHQAGNPSSIVLLTEYKNLAAFQESEKLFASIKKHLPETPGVIRPSDGKNLFETVDTRVFLEEPETNAQLRLLAKQ